MLEADDSLGALAVAHMLDMNGRVIGAPQSIAGKRQNRADKRRSAAMGNDERLFGGPPFRKTAMSDVLGSASRC